MNDGGIRGFLARQDGTHVTRKRVCVKLKAPQNDGYLTEPSHLRQMLFEFG